MQDTYKKLQEDDKRVELCEGLDFCTFPEENTVVIIDDLMSDANNSKKIQTFFTTDVHHKNLSLIFICQNLFSKGKFGRDIRLSTHYIIIFKSPTFLSQVMFLGRQLYPQNPKFLTSAYQQATRKPYSYLFVSTHPNEDDDRRVCSGILPNEDLIVYIPE